MGCLHSNDFIEPVPVSWEHLLEEEKKKADHLYKRINDLVKCEQYSRHVGIENCPTPPTHLRVTRSKPKDFLQKIVIKLIKFKFFVWNYVISFTFNESWFILVTFIVKFECFSFNIFW